jgi:peptidoglycan/xylan/chitin deacetylase (PgdA/CDA1 family)
MIITVKIAEHTKVVISSGNGSKVAYLTFDDGPSAYTNRVLDILKKYNVKATFFVNGREDAISLNIYRRIINEGHVLGNHIYTHKYQNIYTSVETFDNEFNRLQDLILRTTGVTMDIMRFPGGSNNGVSNSYSPNIMNTLTLRYKSLGYTYFDWNVSAGDTWEGSTAPYVINNITSQSRNKSFVIVLMHDSMPTTPASLETVIQNLTSFGFRFSSLSSSTPVIQFK